VERADATPEAVGLPPDPTHVVTVLVHTHNDGSFIEQCLEGIVNQRFSQPYRCVVYDDASTDETVEVARAFAAKHPSLFHLVLQRENQVARGARAPWLASLTPAVSEYVALCAGDDLWLDERKLESQWQFMNRNPWCAVSHHDVEIEVLDDPNDYAAEVTRLISDCRPPIDRVPGTELASGNWIVASAIMLRSSAIPGGLVRLGGARAALDYLVAFLSASTGDIGYIPIPMARYRIHSGDAWTAMTSVERHAREAEALWFLAAHLQGAARDVCRQRLSTIASLGWSGVHA
jgi:glycosyltransferase involved in cell wall biosynthesis